MTTTTDPTTTERTTTERTTATPGEDFARDWAAWHLTKEARLTDPHGFLAVVSLTWLDDAPRRAPGAPGTWVVGPRGVVVTLDPGEQLTVDGAPVRGEHVFGELGLRGSVLAVAGDPGGTVVELAERGGRYVVRPRDPQSWLRQRHPGTPAYAADPRWAVQGRFVPFDAPRPTTVGGAFEGVEHVYDAPGTVDFELEGQPLSLVAFPGHEPGGLTVLFSDATSGRTTYAFRALQLEPAGADGSVVVDFNRAVNLPCAYTDLATCPLPPAGNRLPLGVEAGERTPVTRGTARPTEHGAVLDD